MTDNYPYLYRRASSWVSAFVLIGCVCITVVLVYTAYQANVFGGRLKSSTSSLSDSF